MTTNKKQENVKETAIKLGAIYKESPNDYYYLKGWIHCILQRDYCQTSGNQKNCVIPRINNNP